MGRLHALLLELEAGGIGSEITVNKANQLLEAVTIDPPWVPRRLSTFE